MRATAIGRRAVFLVLGLAALPRRTAAAEDPAFERAMMQAVNQVRRAHGLGAVAVDRRLSRAAADQARDNAARRLLDHRGADGSRVDDRVTRHGYRYALVAENLAANHKDAAASVAAWMESESHRRNLLFPEVTQAGAARVFALDAADPYRTYDALVLARPR